MGWGNREGCWRDRRGIPWERGWWRQEIVEGAMRWGWENREHGGLRITEAGTDEVCLSCREGEDKEVLGYL